MTVAADPDLLRLVLPAVNDLGDRVGRAAGEVADALDRVQATCVDHRPTLGPVDHELRALVAHWRAAGDATAGLADDLDRADSGSVFVNLLDLRSTGDSVVGRLLFHPDLADRILDLLDGDASPDDIDALLDAVQEAQGAADLGAAWTFAADLGRLLHTAGKPQSALARWAMRGSGATFSRWAKVGLAYTLATDAQTIYDAFANHRSGAHKVTALSQTAFDASSLACTVAPSVPTCGAAVVTGVIWGAAEAYEHREGIGRAARLTGVVARFEARRLREAAERRLADGGRLLGDLVDLVVQPGPDLPVVLLAPGLAPLVDQAISAGSRAAGAGRRVVTEGREFARDRYEQGKDAVVGGTRAVGNMVGAGLNHVPGIG